MTSQSSFLDDRQSPGWWIDPPSSKRTSHWLRRASCKRHAVRPHFRLREYFQIVEGHRGTKSIDHSRTSFSTIQIIYLHLLRLIIGNPRRYRPHQWGVQDSKLLSTGWNGPGWGSWPLSCHPRRVLVESCNQYLHVPQLFLIFWKTEHYSYACIKPVNFEWKRSSQLREAKRCYCL